MFKFLAVLLAIVFVPLLFIVHYYSYEKGYEKGKAETLYQNFINSKEFRDYLKQINKENF